MTEIKEKAAVVICVYNNAAALPDVVDRAVLQKCAQVIVVDDGSTDCDVEEILKNKNAIATADNEALEEYNQILQDVLEKKKEIEVPRTSSPAFSC